MVAGILASAAHVDPVRPRRRRLAARLRGPRAVVAHARREPDARGRAARRLGDVGRLHGGGLRLVRHRDRQLHAARHCRRPRGAAPRPRRCSSRNSSPSRWCATSPASGTARSLRALAGAAAWVATEWLVPRLLGDTLGYGLYPSRLLRQAADVGGAAGLTVAAAAGERRRRGGARAPGRRLPRDGEAAGACRAGAPAAGGLRLRHALGHARASRQATSDGTGAVEHRGLRAPAPGEGRRARSFARCSTRTTR